MDLIGEAFHVEVLNEGGGEGRGGGEEVDGGGGGVRKVVPGRSRLVVLVDSLLHYVSMSYL